MKSYTLVCSGEEWRVLLDGAEVYVSYDIEDCLDYIKGREL